MDLNKWSFSLRDAKFSAIITIISFVLFIGVYLFVTIKAVEPYYLEGLIFAIPFICFGVVAYFTGNGKLKAKNSVIITILLIITLSIAMFFGFVFIAMDAATTETTDIAKYERVLKLNGYPENSLISHFPEKIPDNGENIVFKYRPAFMMGSESYNLKFQTDSDSINRYIHHFSQVAKWTGKMDDSKSEGPVKWNHGMLSLVAISKERNEIIFVAEDW